MNKNTTYGNLLGEVCDRKNQRPGLSLGAEAAALGFRGQVGEMRLVWGQKEKKAYRGDQTLGEHAGEHQRDSARGPRGGTALQARLPAGEGEPDLWEGPPSLWAEWPLELRFVWKEEGRETAAGTGSQGAHHAARGWGREGNWLMPRRKAGRTAEGLGALTHSCAGCPHTCY